MKRCKLCRQPARWGRACDECRERVRSAPVQRTTMVSHRQSRECISTERFREALALSTDPPEVVADLLGWTVSRLRVTLDRSSVRASTAERLCRALHVAPVEVGL